jgi:hypothetical protein
VLRCAIATYRHKSAYIESVSRSHRTPSATSIALPDVNRVIRSHVMRKQGYRNPPAPHRSPARLLSQTHSHIHSHTFRSRILHTGTTLYPPLFPYISVRQYLLTAATSSLPPACQPHVSAQREQSASLSAARVSSNFSPTLAQHHSQLSLNYTRDDNTALLASELPILLYYWKILFVAAA